MNSQVRDHGPRTCYTAEIEWRRKTPLCWSGTMQNSVRPLSIDDLDRAAEVLGEAFADYPWTTGASPKTLTWNGSPLYNGSTSNTWHYRSDVHTSMIQATASSQSCRPTPRSLMKRLSRRSWNCTEIGSSAFSRLTNNCLRFPPSSTRGRWQRSVRHRVRRAVDWALRY